MSAHRMSSMLFIALVSIIVSACGGNKSGTQDSGGNSLTAKSSTESNSSGPSDSKSKSTNPPTEKSKDDTENNLINKFVEISGDMKLTRGGKKPAASDTLMLVYGDDPDTLNIITSSDTTSNAFQRQVYESLGSAKFSNPDIWEPSLAESCTFDKKKMKYTFKLRKGVMWHPVTRPDGTVIEPKEFTSGDVEFTWDCILNEHVEAASLRSYYLKNKIEDESDKFKIKVEAVGKYKVEITWSEPYFKMDDFTLGIPILPLHVYAKDEKGKPISFQIGSKEFANGFNYHWANTTMCGTGPLIFKEWKKEQSVLLERNENYWGQPFYFNKIMYQHISNPNTALQKLLQNELDWAGIPQKDHYVQSKEHENVKAGKVKLVEYFYPGYRYIGYNQKRPFFKNKLVRTALSHAVPVDRIIEKIYYGMAQRTSGSFIPGSPSYDESIKPIAYDLEKAKQLLEEAGWKDSDEDGVRDKQIAGAKVPLKFDLMIYSDSPQYRTIATIISENFRKIGVDISITPTKWAIMLQKLNKKEFDACILGWGSEWKTDPYQLWHSSQADVPDSSNFISYRNPELDKLMEQLRVTMEHDKQVELFHKIHRIHFEDQPYTFLFIEERTSGYHSRIQNVEFYRVRPSIDTREWSTTSPR